MKLLLTFSLLLSILNFSSAFHFYLRNGEKECFPQESPQNFVVKGVYKLEEWREQEKRAIEDKALSIHITVDDPRSGTRLINQRSGDSGKFTYTVVSGGRHNVCFEVKSAKPNWNSNDRIRMTLDFAVKDDKEIEKTTEKMNFLHQTLVELNNKITVIRQEQQYQRERELLFHKTNEAINSRIVFWMVAQIFLIIAVCYWQLRHLRKFFEAKKLV
ncbi:hypothetical protein BB560_003555 [Smittium megazygosporum]|uniref:GOLD domain-containing protein n=1 Tax=Smittium megazygosporum TaxID=133381 RepID=A0A2T9ZBT2_9FUNG|nr:hypothetical protein BB560_003555 [Smittium megazygosporum]